MKQKRRPGVIILFALYIMVLIWMILFKGSIHTLQVLFLPEFRGINLVPALNARETLLNFLAFVPVGIYLGMLQKKKNGSFIRLKPVLPIFLLSLFFEAAQYVLALGVSDITDLVGNTLGGMAGLVLYRALEKKRSGKTDSALMILCSISTALLLAFLLAREIWPEALEMGRSIVR